MKNVYKKIAITAIVAIVGIVSYNLQNSTSTLPDLAVKNIEALANGESGGSCRWSRVSDSYGCIYHDCVSNGSGDLCTCGDTRG